jgi:hypothetical protein
VTQIISSQTLPGLGKETSGFSVDMGFIPPLFYTAIKCRNPRIRRQAIELLIFAPHREGFWDGVLVARIAGEVIKLEEKEFYRDFQVNDAFGVYSIPSEEDLSLPALPESYRIHEVQMVPPDNSGGNAMLICKRPQGDGNWEVQRNFDAG